jgi:uncharacterized membrane protein
VIAFLIPVVLLAGGMAAGGLMVSALGGAPMLLSLSVENYLAVHKGFIGRFDPFMPICICTGLVGDVILAITVPTTSAHALATVGALLYLSVLSVSLTKNVPINHWIVTLDPQRPPENWDEIDPRIRWRNWNVVRTTLAVLALIVNVAAVGYLMQAAILP